MLINRICYCGETGDKLPWAGLECWGCWKPWGSVWQEGGSVTLIGDCFQGTGEGGAEPEKRQAAQGQAEEAHGDVFL